jgi:CBS domain-containing protein
MCAQVGALSRSFRWGPFLPVRPDDSLLHVLLLLSKHHLQAVPVVAAESEDATVKGFITQDAAVQLLLQCDGLTWFDLIAEKPLSDLGSVQFTCIYSVRVSSFNIRAHGF